MQVIDLLVIRLDGKVINIGDWDYMLSNDDSGTQIINNPLPENATFKNEQVILNDDGRLTVLNP